MTVPPPVCVGHSNELDVISVGQLALTVLSGEEAAAAHWRPVTGLALTWHSNLNLLPAKTVCRERVAICLTLALLYLSHKDFQKQGSAITETSIKFWLGGDGSIFLVQCSGLGHS